MVWPFLKKPSLDTSSAKDSGMAGAAKAGAPVAAHIPPAYIKRLMPIANLLAEEEIRELFIESEEFLPGANIFSPNNKTDSLVYLYRGTVYLEAANGGGQEISAETLKAFYPLASGSTLGLTVIAKTPVVVIYIPKSVLQLNRFKIVIPPSLKDNHFIQDFHQHLKRGDLEVPTFPDVVLKLRRAIEQGLGVAEVVKIINLDMALTGKLIQVVNSPLYRAQAPITSCLNAVNWLGVETTRNLVTAMTLKNLVTVSQPDLKRRLQEVWKHSIRVSSISYILAKMTGKIDPAEALLGGLLYNVGILPIIMFAANLEEGTYQPRDIDVCIHALQGQVGAFVLNKWDFPEKLKQLPLHAENWFQNSSTELNLSDIVLLAKFHHLLALPSKPALPVICTLPAYQKLPDQPLTPEMSLKVLQDANQQIKEAMQLFTA